MITSEMAPPPFSPPSISLKARSSGAACSATGIRNSSAFSMPSSTRCRPPKRSTWFSTTTPPTSTPRACPRESGGDGLAEAAPTLHLPLHPNFLLLGQCSRRLVCQAHPAAAQARRVHLNRRTSGRHQLLHRRRQRQAKPVRVD